MENVTATRTTLNSDWNEMRKKIDWMSAPGMAEYVNSLVSGKSLNDNGHWAHYANEMHLNPFFERRGRKLDMVSLACGSGHIEASLIQSFNWPIASLLGLEYDDQLRAVAKSTFDKIEDVNSRFEFFDFNAKKWPDNKFDVVFSCHSIHHATDLEGMLEGINNMLAPDGIFIGIDFFGPTRFQIEYEVQIILNELFHYLAPDLRRNLANENLEIEEGFKIDTIEKVRSADPTESVRSSDLRTLLFSNFPVLDLKPMGGTLLRWLLQYRAGNFQTDIPEHLTIIKLLQFIERELIAARRIQSDDLFFVLSKSSRV
jgi:SAM-dependent methyltransferase